MTRYRPKRKRERKLAARGNKVAPRRFNMRTGCGVTAGPVAMPEMYFGIAKTPRPMLPKISLLGFLLLGARRRKEKAA